MLFDDLVFLISPALRPASVTAIQSHGGRTVYSVPERAGGSSSQACGDAAAEQRFFACAIDCAVLPDPPAAAADGRGSSVAAAAIPSSTPLSHFSPTVQSHLRAQRIPAVYESAITCCVQQHYTRTMDSPTLRATAPRGTTSHAGSGGACVGAVGGPTRADGRAIAYDPFCMRGIVFTTTQLPGQVKANVIAAMQFYGATYSPHLTVDTTLLVYSRMLASVHSDSRGEASTGEPLPTMTPAHGSKLAAAQQHGVPCVLPSWVQDCVRLGQRLSFPSPVAPPSSAGPLRQPSAASAAEWLVAVPWAPLVHRNSGHGELAAQKTVSTPEGTASLPHSRINGPSSSSSSSDPADSRRSPETASTPRAAAADTVHSSTGSSPVSAARGGSGALKRSRSFSPEEGGLAGAS